MSNQPFPLIDVENRLTQKYGFQPGVARHLLSTDVDAQMRNLRLSSDQQFALDQLRLYTNLWDTVTGDSKLRCAQKFDPREVLSFWNSDVIASLRVKGMSLDEAEAALIGAREFLLGCGTRVHGSAPLTPTDLEDAAWHEFILFNGGGPYRQFCFEYFGRYIHHRPYNQVPWRVRLNPILLEQWTLVMVDDGCVQCDWGTCSDD